MRSFKSELRDELSEPIRFRDGDTEVEISKQRALIKRLVDSAIEGNQRAMATLLAICVRSFDDADGDDALEASEDREIVEAFARRHVKRRSKISSNNSSHSKE